MNEWIIEEKSNATNPATNLSDEQQITAPPDIDDMKWTDIITEPACFDEKDIDDMEWTDIINQPTDISPDDHVTDAETKNTTSGTQTMDSLTSSQDLQDRLSEVFVSGCYADKMSAEEDNG